MVHHIIMVEIVSADPVAAFTPSDLRFTVFSMGGFLLLTKTVNPPGTEDAECFGRRIESGVIKTASTVFIMYITLCFVGAAVISAVENISFGMCLFETASAVGTVGLTLGITPKLGMLSQMILIVLMFLGRVGGLTVIYAAISKASKKISKLPQEKITVG